ncbi:MAG: hypothetical protein ACTHK8_19065 [Ginsengibacter sp.]
MLDKNVLGEDLYNRSKVFNDTPIDPADLEAQRLAWWQTIAEGIIEHFKANAGLVVPGAGLVAGTTPVTGESVTGTIE